jgi:ketosteroid isomerase-like protein
MPEEPATPDLVELTRRAFKAGSSVNLDGYLSFFAPDGVWDSSRTLGTRFEGVPAIRGFFEDWIAAYEDWETELEEALDLGNGVVLSVIHQNARPVGSTGSLGTREAFVYAWTEGVIVGVTVYPHIDEGRAAAERLAEERG